jgi:hypothetical protein
VSNRLLSPAAADELGATIQEFRAKVTSATARAVHLVLISLGCFILMAFMERYAGKLLFLGGAGIISSVVMFLFAAYQCSQPFYICEHGIRYRGTSIAWHEIEVIKVNRSGPYTYNADTREDVDIRIHSRDGRLVRLTDYFLDHVPNKGDLLEALAPFVRS